MVKLSCSDGFVSCPNEGERNIMEPTHLFEQTSCTGAGCWKEGWACGGSAASQPLMSYPNSLFSMQQSFSFPCPPAARSLCIGSLHLSAMQLFLWASFFLSVFPFCISLNAKPGYFSCWQGVGGSWKAAANLLDAVGSNSVTCFKGRNFPPCLRSLAGPKGCHPAR